jgi:hypothetical protein
MMLQSRVRAPSVASRRLGARPKVSYPARNAFQAVRQAVRVTTTAQLNVAYGQGKLKSKPRTIFVGLCPVRSGPLVPSVVGAAALILPHPRTGLRMEF